MKQLHSAVNRSMGPRWTKSLMSTNVTGRVGQVGIKILGINCHGLGWPKLEVGSTVFRITRAGIFPRSS
jgi:hypothetical protein